MDPKVRLLCAALRKLEGSVQPSVFCQIWGEIRFCDLRIGSIAFEFPRMLAAEVRTSLRKIATYCKWPKALVPKVSMGVEAAPNHPVST